MCPVCGAKYVGKTERTLYELCVENAWSDDNRLPV